MGLSYRKRVKIDDDTSLNISKSGPSISRRFGRVSVNSRGRVNVRLAKGLTWRGGCATVLVLPLAAVAAAATWWVR